MGTDGPKQVSLHFSGSSMQIQFVVNYNVIWVQDFYKEWLSILGSNGFKKVDFQVLQFYSCYTHCIGKHFSCFETTKSSVLVKCKQICCFIEYKNNNPLFLCALLQDSCLSALSIVKQSCLQCSMQAKGIFG